MTPRLRIYLELERLMLALENVDGRAADALRDAMDPIWYALTEQERGVLDQRSVGVITDLEGLRVPVDDRLYCPELGPPKDRPLPHEPIQGWRKAAA